MSLIELENEILKLDFNERASLARWLFHSFDDLSDEDVLKLWADEAERRLDEMEQGQAVELSAEDVFRRARAAIA